MNPNLVQYYELRDFAQKIVNRFGYMYDNTYRPFTYENDDDVLKTFYAVDLYEKYKHEIISLEMKKQKKEHLPECPPLYDIPAKSGAKAALKTGEVNDD